MRTGNLRQAIPLGLTAVGAVLFLTYQISGLGGAALRPTRAQSEPTVRKGEVADRPSTVIGDPFGRLSLVLARAKAAPARKDAPTPTPPRLEGSVGGLGPLVVEPLPRPVVDASTGDAKGSGDEGRKLEGTPKITVRVTAIVSAEERVAYVAVNGGASAMVRSGSTVAADVEVLAVADDHVTFRVGRRQLRVRPGSEVAL